MFQVLTATFLKVAGAGFGLLISILLIDALSVDELGIYYAVQSVAVILGVVFSMGVANAVLPLFDDKRFIGDGPQTVCTSAITLCVFLSSLGVCLLVLAGWLWGKFSADEIPHAVLFSAAALSATWALQLVLVQCCRAKEKIAFAAIVQNGQGRNLMFGPLLCLVYFQDGYRIGLTGIFSLQILSSLIPIALCLRVVSDNKFVPRFSLPLAKRIIKMGLGFLPSALVTFSSPHLILLIVAVISGSAAAGVFGLAQRVAGAAGFVRDAIMLGFMKASREYLLGNLSSANHIYLKNLFGALGSTSLLMVVYYVIGEPILYKMTDAEKLEGLDAVLALTFSGQIILSVGGFSLMFLRNIGARSEVNASCIWSALFSIFVTVLAAPVGGAVGGGIGLVSYFLFSSGISIALLYRKVGIPTLPGYQKK